MSPGASDFFSDYCRSTGLHISRSSSVTSGETEPVPFDIPHLACSANVRFESDGTAIATPLGVRYRDPSGWTSENSWLGAPAKLERLPPGLLRCEIRMADPSEETKGRRRYGLGPKRHVWLRTAPGVTPSYTLRFDDRTHEISGRVRTWPSYVQHGSVALLQGHVSDEELQRMDYGELVDRTIDSAGIDHGGLFRFDRLEPGSYTLQVSMSRREDSTSRADAESEARAAKVSARVTIERDKPRIEIVLPLPKDDNY
ncbi:MAG: hypothetical protein L0Z55_01910 [Planctomycetes bacterium]|nr:hypothetical protein [Planctomycetota bacterium]